MMSRQFTPKTASLNISDPNLATKSRPPNQFTPKCKFGAGEQQNRTTMTAKRANADDAEIKLSINAKLIRDSQKILQKYSTSTNAENTSQSSYPTQMQSHSTAKRIRTMEYNGNDGNLKLLHEMNLNSNHTKSITTINQNKIRYDGKPTTEEKTKTRDVDRKMVHLIGYVEQVLKWSQILKNVEISVLYDVLGIYINVINGTYPMEKYIFIKGDNGMVMECIFFEVDRPLPAIKRGQFIGCFGHVIGPQKLRLYDVQILQESEKNEVPRAIYLSERIVNELNNHKIPL